MRQSTALLSFNRGLISRLGLARVDIKRIALSASILTNWIPRVLGSMSIRPGMKYIGATKSNAAARFLAFIFSITDTAKIELTASLLRVWVSDALVTRGSVSSAVTNGNFTTDVASWTDNDEAGATSQWVAPGYMQLAGNGTAAAIRDQSVTVGAADQSDEHALRIVIARGPVYLRVGTSAGDDSYIAETALDTGTHSLTLTPTGNFNIRFFSRQIPVVWVDSVNVEAAGVMEIATPWTASDLGKVRYDQSGDIVFCACAGFQQRLIERRSTTSWSVVLYKPNDGPFKVENTGPITITPSALTGNVTLTASSALFKSTQVGALFSITSEGQTVSSSIAAQNTFTNAIRITGVDSSRVFTIVLTGTWVATVTLQRSLESDTGPWEDMATTYTTNTTTTFDDGLDNQIAWYRIGVKTGNYTSGTVVATLDYSLGSITGIVRLTAFTTSVSATAEVLTALGGTTATDVWAEGEWSDYRGWPTAVALHEGRLWWAGKSGIWGSVSDAFTSFDRTTIGDSGPISRTLGSGPVDIINWLLSSQRLLIGAQGAEYAARSSSLDEPLTPTAFTVKVTSTQGSGGVSPVRIDGRGVFVNRTSTRVYETALNPSTYDYSLTDLSQLVPDIGSPAIVRMAVQRQPDTRIHCVRSDGTVALAVFDKAEEVLCWSEVETDGEVEDVMILPAASGNADDSVYYVVKRTINSATVRYLEKWAQSDTCFGAAVCNLADSYINYTGAATTAITGLSHLEGKSVVVWANGSDVGTNTNYTRIYTVASGSITLAALATNVTVGLPYTAQFQSAKLGEATRYVPTPLGRLKRITNIGMILADTHAKGIRFGPDFTNLDSRPEIDNGTTVSANNVDTAYDEDPIQFPSTWGTDIRLCLQAQAPRPATVLAVSLEMEIA